MVVARPRGKRTFVDQVESSLPSLRRRVKGEAEEAEEADAAAEKGDETDETIYKLCYIALENGPFKVDLPIQYGDFPEQTVSLPEGILWELFMGFTNLM
jgi:hypothetical protein